MGGPKKNLAVEIERLERRLQAEPGAGEFYRLADLYTRAGRFDEAVTLCRDGLKQHPSSASGYVALGRALFGQGNLAEACEVLRRALGLERGRSEPFRLLGEVLMRLGRFNEAVKRLEQATDSGVADSKVASLLRRARAALDRQETQVTAAPGGDGNRGIGNRTVAGSIDRHEGEPPPAAAPIDEEVTRRVASPDPALVITEGDESKTRTVAAPPASPADEETPTPRAVDPRQLRSSPDWSSIGNLWEEQLDAGLGEEGPHADSDLRGPFMRRSGVGLPIEPLADPLAEEMPPLPPEALMTQEVDPSAYGVASADRKTSGPAVTSEAVDEDDELTQEALLAETSDAEPFVPEAVDVSPTAVGGRALAEPDLDGDPRLDAEPLGETLPPFSMPFDADATPAEAPVSPRDLAGQRAAAFRELASPAAGRDGEQAGSLDPVLSAMREADRGGAGPEVGEDAADEGADGPEPALRRSGRRRGWLWLLLLLTVAGAGGYYGWRHLQRRDSNERLLAAAVHARRVGSAPALAAAAAALRAARDASELRGEAELLSALGWLVHRDGKPALPALQKGAKSWSAVAARAALAVADKRVSQARRLLVGFDAERPADRAAGRLLLAWAGWVDGKPEQAAAELERALAQDAKLSLAWLLRGHLSREGGDLAAAARAYREAMRLNPEGALARLGLAATLLAEADADGDERAGVGSAATDASVVGAAGRDAAAGDAAGAGDAAAGDAAGAGDAAAGGRASTSVARRRIERLLEAPGRGPVAQAWARVLAAELALRSAAKGEAGKGLVDVLGEAPPEPALLYDGIEALSLACDFDGLRTIWEKLRVVREDSSPPVRVLEALVAIAEGKEALVARRLAEAKRPAPWILRTRLLALLLAGQARAAQALLADGGRAPSALRLTIEGLVDPTRPLHALQRLAATEAHAGLGLTLVLRARHRWALAEGVARALASRPRWRGRALTYVAEALERRGQRTEAIETLRQVLRACPGYLPARERLGASLVYLGAYEEGVRLLAAARDKGRVTPGLLANLARGYAELGRKNAALTVLGELRRAGQGGDTAALRLAEGFVRLVERQPKAALAAFQQAGVGLVGQLGRGRALQALDRRAAAAQAFGKAVASDPDHPLPHIYLGQLHQDRPAVALKHFQRAIELAARGRGYPRWVQSWAHIGIARAGGDDRATPIAHLRAAIKAEPSSALGYRLLGEQHLRARKLARARAALKRSLQINPDDPEAWHALGLAAGRDHRAARAAFERFLALQPRGRRAGDVRRRLGRLR